MLNEVLSVLVSRPLCLPATLFLESHVIDALTNTKLRENFVYGFME